MIARLLALLTAWRWDRRIRARALAWDRPIFADAPDEVLRRWAAKTWPEDADVKLREATHIARAFLDLREREANECFWRECEREV